MEGPLTLDRFVDAQAGGVFERALAELQSGRKTSHWMWFIFPQLRGLGRSERAVFYGIADLDEAAAYAGHQILGPRLTACAAAIHAQKGLDPVLIMGPVDAVKLRSSATLFAMLPNAPRVFSAVLEDFFAGQRCQQTLQVADGLADPRHCPS